jgi:hypothetical protein
MRAACQARILRNYGILQCICVSAGWQGGGQAISSVERQAGGRQVASRSVQRAEPSWEANLHPLL